MAATNIEMDPSLDRLLSSAECSPRHDIVEQLIMDYDFDMLDEARTYQFSKLQLYLSTQCEKLYGPVSTRGEDQIDDIKPKRRTGDKKIVSMANDIYDMYVYLMCLTDHFPRNILTPTRRLPEGFARGPDAQRNRVIDAPAAPSVMDLTAKVTEITMDYRRVIQEMDLLKRKCSKLEEDVKILTEKVCLQNMTLEKPAQGNVSLCPPLHNTPAPADLSKSPNKANCMSTTATKAAVSNPINSTQPVLRQHNSQTLEPQGASNTKRSDTAVVLNNRISSATESVTQTTNRFAVLTDSANCGQGQIATNPATSNKNIMPDLPDKQSKHASSEKQDGGIAHTGKHVHTSDNEDQSGFEVLMSQDKMDRESKDTENDWCIYSSRRNKRHYSTPVSGQIPSKTPLSFANVVSKPKPKTSAPTKTPAPIPTRTKPGRGLRGVTAVRTTTLYLENIAKEDIESDEDIILQVKDCALDSEINIRQAYIVHNKVSTKRVGCKIIIPKDHVERALSMDAWPHPVKCRKWEYLPKRKRNTYRDFKQMLAYNDWNSEVHDLSGDDNLDYDNIYEATNEFYRISQWGQSGNNMILNQDDNGS
ncbi:unnamed protein product [Owenia fusiformis]|uniref:Uncharacterized protein n=1 Tax=Owenia fusiformis TaxID=6347 RepID=A0A8J1UCS1_OWEFU|nr:unnamed protein product [Owenia fusiformis]